MPLQEERFRTTNYVRHNMRRLEHLTSLGLPLEGREILELGAGIGDHTAYFLDRGCKVLAIEGRDDNIDYMRDALVSLKRYQEGKDFRLLLGDLDDPRPIKVPAHDVVYCYGLLYHVSAPARLVRWMARKCTNLLLLETCVSYHDERPGRKKDEDIDCPTQALHGQGSRPSRPELLAWLKQGFEYVYFPVTQPAHEQFPLDWTLEKAPGQLTRAIFVASRTPITDNALLTEELPKHYRLV
ncbi:MAG: class I SAM-dependent methyltransferase [Pseudomonadota bacterium]